MQYAKPEINVLGDAALVIQGSKQGTGEVGHPLSEQPIADVQD
jgi:hypothetical protein